MRTGRGILEVVREHKVLTEEQIAAVLDPMAMTGQGRPAWMGWTLRLALTKTIDVKQIQRYFDEC
jgi:hypothetical protein